MALTARKLFQNVFIVVPHFFCVFDFIQFILYDQSNAYICSRCNMSVSIDDLISVLLF